MGDYLGELVAKNIGTAEVILPRRAARFETAQGKNEFEEQPEPLQMERFRERQVIEPMPPIQPQRTTKQDKSGKAQEIEVRRNSDDQISHSLGVSPAVIRKAVGHVDVSEISSSPQVTETQRELPSRKLPNRSVRTELEQLPQKPFEDHQKFHNKIESPRVNTPNSVPLDPIQTATNKMDLEQTNDLSGPINSQHEVEIHNQIVEKHSAIIIRPRIEQVENRFKERAIHQAPIQFPRGHDQNSGRAEAVEAPTINVSIGRVEIRAVVPSAAPRETRAKPQTLSLDEYLQKRRTGGER